MKKRLTAALLCLCFLYSLLPAAHAESSPVATDISAETAISGTGYEDFSFLTDKDTATYLPSADSAQIVLQSSSGIHALYLLFHLEYGAYTVENNDTGATLTAGEYGFLHEYINLAAAFSAAPTSVTIHFSSGSVQLSEIYAFSSGETPDFVQKWEPPHDGKTDLLLFSTHGDDEQLFFAGLLPYYAGHLNVNVQVVYLTDHRNITLDRTHEMLNGLWGVGVRAYPVFGSFLDMRIDDLEKTYVGYESYGITKDDFMAYVVEQIRRFKPQVAVGHDINGEYGHGMHRVYTDCLMDALELTNDPSQYPESAEKYGLWDVPKTYLHLYEENPIVIDYDQPLSTFDGLTAFQVTQKYGYSCHLSQHKYWFTPWLYGETGEITKASQITEYSPCQFGLYRSTVGADVQKNDFLENITTYGEAQRLEQERFERERREKERLEQERLEKERQQQEKQRQDAQRLQTQQIAIVSAAIAMLAATALTVFLVRHAKRKKTAQKTK